MSDIHTYRWLLSSVTDVNGNVITYEYAHSTASGTRTCGAITTSGVVDLDAWLTQITWGGGRYRATFATGSRITDLVSDDGTASTQFLESAGIPRETKQLNQIQVLSKQGATWELIRQYEFSYDSSLLSDAWTCGPGFQTPCSATATSAKLTLTRVVQRGKDGSSAYPPIVFTYNTTSGSGVFPSGGWNRLTKITTGQGGSISYAYAHIGTVTNSHLFENRYRVTSVTVGDGLGQNSTWNYTYQTPNVNALGTTLDNGHAHQGWGGMTADPNSALLYYNTYSSVDNPPFNLLSERIGFMSPGPLKEFRGHKVVTVTDPSGAATEHYFQQGEAACHYPNYPSLSPLTGTGMTANSCFADLRWARHRRDKSG